MTVAVLIPFLCSCLLALAEPVLASNWTPLPGKKGVGSGSGDWTMSVSCDASPNVQLLLGPNSEVLGSVVRNAKLDGKSVLNGKGWDLGLDFVPRLGSKPHFELASAPLDLIRRLKGASSFEADVAGAVGSATIVRIDLRGFGAAYDSTCKPSAVAATMKPSSKGRLLSTPVASGWRLQLKHDCKGGEFIFEPDSAAAKWDMEDKLADGKELSSDPMKTEFDGDMSGAIRFPYDQTWFDTLKNSKTLTVEVTDYSTTGGVKKADVRFDLREFCGGS